MNSVCSTASSTACLITNYFVTCRIDFAIAIPSTGTTEPINNPVTTGVTTTEDIVEQLVNKMLNATSPLLKKLA
jgi:hypothetical protein